MSQRRHSSRSSRSSQSNWSLGTSSDIDTGRIGIANKNKINRNRIEVALGQFVDPRKTNYDSRVCQIRDVGGKKCRKMAVAHEENGSPVCNDHLFEINRMKQAEKEIDFVNALDLLRSKQNQ